MKSLIPILGLSLLLAACSTPTPPPTPTTASISIDGPAALKIGEDKTIAASAKSSSGVILSGHTFTWTSSAPNVVDVDASGKLTVKRLSVSPVTLTASDGGKSGTLTVTTYGLELTMGTFNFSPATPDAEIGISALVKFRGPGSSIGGTNVVKITGPTVLTNANLKIGPSTTNQDYSYYLAGSVKPVSGLYAATIIVDNVTYTSSDTLDGASVLGGFQNGNIKFTDSKNYTLNGKFASEAKYYREVFYNDTDTAATPTQLPIDNIPELPISYKLTIGLSKATYSPYIDSFNLQPGDLMSLTPESFNVSRTPLPIFTIN
ncbi:hypothetical protein EHF33_03505 [Deinococcus psychrotolerans]|uniref:BIG2 domain-containing protein n=1 Tax=Deinococcus psychrotolerans TaxID=2489213 RepID=A0A3G8YKA6_9DEIO|nr:hypothetical protein [Deinococcus psychrotolerans]AZI41931.1 hypothetical protein EHF33_03505 [Deinococcus psychrotolerans]